MTMPRCCGCLNKFRAGSLSPLRACEAVPPNPHEEFCKPCRKGRMKYYVLAVEPGEDERVRRRLNQKIKVQDMGGEIDLVLVPRHAEFRARPGDGKPVRRAKKSTPGYLVLRMHFSDDAYVLIKSVPGAWDLLPMKPVLNRIQYPKKDKPKKLGPKPADLDAHYNWCPTALDTEEAALLLLRHAGRKDRPAPTGRAAVGDRVFLTGGLFEGQTGTVRRVCGEGEKEPDYEVVVRVLGREVAVTVGHWQFAAVGEGE